MLEKCHLLVTRRHSTLHCHGSSSPIVQPTGGVKSVTNKFPDSQRIFSENAELVLLTKPKIKDCLPTLQVRHHDSTAIRILVCSRAPVPVPARAGVFLFSPTLRMY